MARVTRFDYKFPGMRKPDSFIVYPRRATDTIIVVQGHRSIASITSDGVGLLNYKGSHPKYLPHLSRAMGAEQVVFPADFLKLVLEHEPHSGDLIGSSAVTGPVYIA